MFRIAWWTSAGKELTSGLSACAVFTLSIIDVDVLDRIHKLDAILQFFCAGFH